MNTLANTHREVNLQDMRTWLDLRAKFDISVGHPDDICRVLEKVIPNPNIPLNAGDSIVYQAALQRATLEQISLEDVLGKAADLLQGIKKLNFKDSKQYEDFFEIQRKYLEHLVSNPQHYPIHEALYEIRKHRHKCITDVSKLLTECEITVKKTNQGLVYRAMTNGEYENNSSDLVPVMIKKLKDHICGISSRTLTKRRVSDVQVNTLIVPHKFCPDGREQCFYSGYETAMIVIADDPISDNFRSAVYHEAVHGILYQLFGDSYSAVAKEGLAMRLSEIFCPENEYTTLRKEGRNAVGIRAQYGSKVDMSETALREKVGSEYFPDCELAGAPYTLGHLIIGFLYEEYGNSFVMEFYRQTCGEHNLRHTRQRDIIDDALVRAFLTFEQDLDKTEFNSKYRMYVNNKLDRLDREAEDLNSLELVDLKLAN